MMQDHITRMINDLVAIILKTGNVGRKHVVAALRDSLDSVQGSRALLVISRDEFDVAYDEWLAEVFNGEGVELPSAAADALYRMMRKKAQQ